MSKTLTTRKPSSMARSPFQGLIPRAMFDDLLDEFWSGRNRQVSEMMNVAMDVAETDQAFEIKMDLPGVKVDDVDIQINNNTLTVRGQRCEESEVKDEEKQYHRIERYSGSFARSMVLPNAVNEDETAAVFKDGVLKIVIPKNEDAKPRKIKVKT
jgi:HSP20 family protein